MTAAWPPRLTHFATPNSPRLSSPHGLRPRATRPGRVVALLAVILAGANPAWGGQPPDMLWWRGGHAGSRIRVAFSPDGQPFASGGLDATVKLWRTADGQLLRTATGHTEEVIAIAFSGDGSTLASASYDNTVRLWRVPEATLIRALTNEYGNLLSMALSSDGRWVACGTGTAASVPPKGCTVQLWDVTAGRLVQVLTNGTIGVNGVGFSPNSQRLAAALGVRLLVQWQVASATRDWTVEGQYAVDKCLAYAPDGQTLATGGDYGYVKLWRVSDGALMDTFQAHRHEIASLAWAPDGTVFATGGHSFGAFGSDPVVKLWSVRGATMPVVQTTDTLVDSVGFSRDGTILASGGGGCLRFWNVADGTLARTLTGHQEAITAVGFSPDGQHVASGGRDPTIRLWRVADGSAQGTLQGLNGETRGIVFSPDGRTVVGGDSSTMASLRGWRVADGQPLWDRSLYPDSVSCLAGASTTEFFAVGVSASGGRGRLELRRHTDGLLLQTLNGQTSCVWSVNFSPDGRWLAAASRGQDVRVWQPPRPDPVYTLDPETEATAVAFSPDNALLAGGTVSGTVHIWRVADGARLRTLFGHSGQIGSLAFAPDGEILLSSSADRVLGGDGGGGANSVRPNADSTLRVWGTANGALLTTYDAEVRAPLCLASHPYRRLFAFGRSDATLGMARCPIVLETRPLAPSGAMRLRLYGAAEEHYQLETSTDLRTWQHACDLDPDSDRFDFEALDEGASMRCYRVRSTSEHGRKGASGPAESAHADANSR